MSTWALVVWRVGEGSEEAGWGLLVALEVGQPWLPLNLGWGWGPSGLWPHEVRFSDWPGSCKGASAQSGTTA